MQFGWKWSRAGMVALSNEFIRDPSLGCCPHQHGQKWLPIRIKFQIEGWKKEERRKKGHVPLFKGVACHCHLQLIGQNLVTWPHLPATRGGKCSPYSVWPCCLLKIGSGGFLLLLRKENGYWKTTKSSCHWYQWNGPWTWSWMSSLSHMRKEIFVFIGDLDSYKACNMAQPGKSSVENLFAQVNNDLFVFFPREWALSWHWRGCLKVKVLGVEYWSLRSVPRLCPVGVFWVP